jgi:hypothetical protein
MKVSVFTKGVALEEECLKKEWLLKRVLIEESAY